MNASRDIFKIGLSFLVLALLALTACAPAGSGVSSQENGAIAPLFSDHGSITSPLERPADENNQLAETSEGITTDTSSQTTNEDVGTRPQAPDENAAEEPSKSQPSKPMATLAMWDGKLEAESWTEATLRAIDELGPALLTTAPRDATDFCPNFAALTSAERRAFWLQLISAMAFQESSLNPTLVYVEAFTDRSSQNVHSRGLLQISFESANAYGCGFKTAQEIHHPGRNLRCGVKILNHWIENDGVISAKGKKSWLGGARYWAVLRTPSKKKFISQATAHLAFCQRPTTQEI